MASFDVETGFVSSFWAACLQPEYHPVAWTALEFVSIDAFEHGTPKAAYLVLRDRFVAAESVGTADVLDEFGKAGIETRDAIDIQESHPAPWEMKHYANLIVRSKQKRTVQELCEKAAGALRDGVGDKDGGKHLVERVMMRLMSIYSRTGGAGDMKSKEQLVAEGIQRAVAEEESGAPYPWPKVDRHCGPLMPGDLVGITAYSGCGKSTFAGNLFRHFVRRGYPVIAYPTEMGAQWLDRVVAAEARVESWRAEKRRWRGAEDQRDRYVAAYEQFRQWEWAIINRPNISPAEIITATRIVRRRWPGQMVIVIIDHMHRLDYAGEDADKAVGPATKDMKNLAKADEEGGLAVIALFQPKKPGIGATIYSPVAAHQIRGHSMVWNELDVHLAPFRAWVETSPFTETRWGTLAGRQDEHGKPKIVKPESDGAKLDDEHFYVKIDKRRVGGEGPKLFLDIDAPSGDIFEMADDPEPVESYG